MPLKRVTTREFLRNINSMTEPVEVYSRATLKGTWHPATTWGTDLVQAGKTKRAAVPHSEPSVQLGADVEVPSESGGSFGTPSPRRGHRPWSEVKRVKDA